MTRLVAAASTLCLALGGLAVAAGVAPALIAALNACGITQLTDTTGFTAPAPVISEDGNLVAFRSARDLTGSNADGNLEMFTVVPGGATTQVTSTTGGHVFEVALDADGSHGAFAGTVNPTSGNADGNNEVFTVALAGPTVTQITSTTGGTIGNINPALDDDGDVAAFVSDIDINAGNADLNLEVYTAVPAGPTITQRTNSSNGTGNGSPILNDLGTRMALVSGRDLAGNPNSASPRPTNVFSHDLGGSFTQLTNFPSVIQGPTNLDATDDLATSVFDSLSDLTTGNGDENREIFSVSSTGTVTQLTTTTGGAQGNFDPSISDDGSTVAFLSDRDLTGGNADGNIEIFSRASNGAITQITDTTSTAVLTDLSIDGDGQRMAFSSNRDLAGANADGNAEVFLADCDAPPPPGPVSVANEAEYRAALSLLSADPSPGHTIEVTADITIAGPTDPSYTSATQPLTVNGNGHTLDGGGNSRVLKTTGSPTVTFTDVTIRNGTATDGGGVQADTGSVTVVGSTLSANTATTGNGGAVHAAGTVTARDSSVLANTAAGDGGGLAGGKVVATNSTVTANEADGSGGGLDAGDTVTLMYATVASNAAPVGANLHTNGNGLTSGLSVISDPLGGGLNCNALLEASLSHNYTTDASCGFTEAGDTFNGADPRLGQARDNGSPPTMFPLNGSPLIDVIPSGLCPSTPLDVDQRGVDRPFGGGCDIGAIEAVFPAHAFSDVTPFYEAAVRWITSDVNDPQILLGFNDGTFRHPADISRGQLARVYYRAAGAPSVTGLPGHGFSDVTTFFQDAVRWSKSEGLFDGFSDGTFRQDAPITRGNFTRSLYRFAGSPSVTGLPAHGFSDVTPFYEDAVRWAKANGLVNGFPDNTFRQARNLSRGDASRIMYNTAQTPTAWADTMVAPDSMLFRSNL